MRNCLLSLLLPTLLLACTPAPSLAPAPLPDPAASAFLALWQTHATPDALPFWIDQFHKADDPALRNRCLLAYFTLLPVPTTAEKIRTDLANPAWFTTAEIAIVHGIGGRIPVHLRQGETVFCIRVPLPYRSPLYGNAIYLGAKATLTTQSLRDALTTPPSPADPPIPIDQIGVTAFGEPTNRRAPSP